jgi:hypothetical protein
MTHDELLTKITTEMFQFKKGGFSRAYMQALDAIVKLHKPVNTNILQEEYIGCNACFAQSHEFKVYKTYPCQTIQAIEKELG